MLGADLVFTDYLPAMYLPIGKLKWPDLTVIFIQVTFGGAVAQPYQHSLRHDQPYCWSRRTHYHPWLYDNVEEVPQAEREMIAQIPFDEEKYKASIGVKELFGEKGIPHWAQQLPSVFWRLWHLGWLYRWRLQNCITFKSLCKVSCRLVPHQDHHKISKLFH